MQVSIDEKAKTITITLPIGRQLSKSGKSLVIASSKGNKASEAKFEGKQVVVGVNAYVFA